MNKLLFTLALRNLLGAGKRTWLNVSVLSFAFVVIIFYNGMLDGWNRQALRDSEQWSIAKGQLWHPAYDPYDANSLADAHASIPDTLRALCRAGIISPQLIVQGAIFPQGRMLNVQLRGIDPNQKVLLIPAGSLLRQSDAVPAVIGKRMARLSNLKAGDRALIQWRDVHGTFDAREIVITSIFSANVPAIDNGYIWLNISTLQQLTGLAGQATLFTISSSDAAASTANWNYRPAEYLMSDLNEIINAKRSGSALIYGLLLVLALLAIFDTQVLSVFRRKKEIGTYMALGMTRGQVIGIFTVEGSAHSILAIALGTAYGMPVLCYIQHAGIPMPQSTDAYGLAIADRIIPAYSIAAILSTVLMVVVSATVVSYLPSRKIAKMLPTEALKGNIQ